MMQRHALANLDCDRKHQCYAADKSTEFNCMHWWKCLKKS